MTGLDLGDLVVAGNVAVHVASVVRVEDEDGVLAQPELVELGQYPPEAFVDALEHGGHDGVALLAPWILLLGKSRGVCLLVPPRPMDAIVPNVEIKGLCLLYTSDAADE